MQPTIKGKRQPKRKGTSLELKSYTSGVFTGWIIAGIFAVALTSCVSYQDHQKKAAVMVGDNYFEVPVDAEMP